MSLSARRAFRNIDFKRSRSFWVRAQRSSSSAVRNFYSLTLSSVAVAVFVASPSSTRWKWKRRSAKATHRCVDKWLGNSSRTASRWISFFFLMYSVQWLIWRKMSRGDQGGSKTTPTRVLHIQPHIPRPFIGNCRYSRTGHAFTHAWRRSLPSMKRLKHSTERN